MQYHQIFLLYCQLFLPATILSAPLPDPQLLFRDTALVHQSSHSSPLNSLTHHSHSVQDSTSSSHSHHTSRGVLHSPSLVQHADGRLFAVNANLQPGQLFQTADGRIFTLATPALSTTPQQDQAAQVVEAREGTDREEDTEEVSE